MGALAYPDFVLEPSTPAVVHTGMAAPAAVPQGCSVEAHSGMKTGEIVTAHAW